MELPLAGKGRAGEGDSSRACLPGLAGLWLRCHMVALSQHLTALFSMCPEDGNQDLDTAFSSDLLWTIPLTLLGWLSSQ